jgi:uncharacterized protein (TIGR03067 family)
MLTRQPLPFLQRRTVFAFGVCSFGWKESAGAWFALLCLLCASSPAPAQGKLQGDWKVLSAHVGRNKLIGRQLKGWEVLIDGDKFTLVEGSKKESVHFSVNATVTPHTIDFFKTSAKKEKVWHGIYSLSDEELTMCWGPAGQPRPTEYGTDKSTKNRYYILKKR